MKNEWVMLLMMALACGVVMAQEEQVPEAPAVPAPNTVVGRAIFQISGKVVNSVTGAAVRGAKVEIASATQREQTRDVLTSDTGQFAFDKVAAGKYSLA